MRNISLKILSFHPLYPPFLFLPLSSVCAFPNCCATRPRSGRGEENSGKGSCPHGPPSSSCGAPAHGGERRRKRRETTSHSAEGFTEGGKLERGGQSTS